MLTPDSMVEFLRDAPAGTPVYLIGAGGCGVSALGHLLLDLGFHVAGSDRVLNPDVADLKQRGARIEQGHDPERLRAAKPALVVHTAAVKADQPEIVAAMELGVPVVTRAAMLSALASLRCGIAVAGMHGKTTTSALLGFVLKTLRDDAGFAIGARVPQLIPSARMGGGDAESPFVYEADESDGTLCRYRPRHALLLNVDSEHLDHYANLDAVVEDFRRFGEQTTDTIIYCADDDALRAAFANRDSAFGYGFGPHATYRAEIQVVRPDVPTVFEVWRDNVKLGVFKLRLLGEKNVMNATAAIALLDRLGFATDDIARAVAEFRGVARRQQELFRDSRFRVFDDYGHHPREIKSVIRSLRDLEPRRLLVAFQPHRYTRTKHLLPEFASAFTEADQLWLAEIYAASEQAIPGISSDVLADAIRTRGQAVELAPGLLQMSGQIRAAMRPGDLVLFLGAGDITQVAHALAVSLRNEARETGGGWFDELKSALSPETVVLRDEPLARRTTLRVGGRADILVEPANEEDLARVLRFCERRQAPFVLLGRGSNLLIRDGGVRGVVISLSSSAFSEVRVDGGRLVCGAGARLKAISVEARRHGIAGLEFLEGIPGSLGGSMRMNAGAMGSWLFDVIETIRFMDYSGNVIERRASEVHVEYRGCPLFKNHIALGAVLAGETVDAAAVRERMDAYSRKRWESQPRQPSAGCIFKNPTSIGAGKLIDELGLKGARVGGAMVSDVHGNFIVNEGGATAADVLELIEVVRARVRQARGIELETEVEILGEG